MTQYFNWLKQSSIKLNTYLIFSKTNHFYNLKNASGFFWIMGFLHKMPNMLLKTLKLWNNIQKLHLTERLPMFGMDPVPRLNSQCGVEGWPRDVRGWQELSGEGHGRIHPSFFLLPSLCRQLCRKNQSSGIFANHPKRQYHVALADSQYGKPSTKRYANFDGKL